jgi:hypothetical protein
MSLLTALRLNMTNIADPAAHHAKRYQAALEMAEHADTQGFTAISGEEHHLAATSWLPSPLILAAVCDSASTRSSCRSTIRFGSPRTRRAGHRRPGPLQLCGWEIVINPLVGGLPIDEGWASLQLLTDQVLPRV